MMASVLRAVAAAAAAATMSLPMASSAWMKGLSFAGGEHSQGRYGTAASARSLRNLAATGATAVRLEPTWFQATVSSTTIYPMATPGSPLDSTPDAALVETVAKAHELNLTVVLAPLVDLDWDLPAVNTPLGAGSITAFGLNQWTPKT
eukprot:SAG22_NODE_4243_length_1330_cov_1.041430_2_plen_147_part_01